MVTQLGSSRGVCAGGDHHMRASTVRGVALPVHSYPFVMVLSTPPLQTDLDIPSPHNVLPQRRTVSTVCGQCNYLGAWPY